MDKAWAVRRRAWMARQSTPTSSPAKYGSWVFLGELLLSIELDV
jgi:hypothetical protein